MAVAAGGGGFMNQTSPQSQSQAGSKDRISTLTPVSISQIHSASASGDSFTLYDGLGLGQVSLIGIIREVEQKATKTSYTVEDHTGTTEVTKWADKDNEDEAGGDANCRENMYVEVIGQIKEFNDKRSISAFSVRPVDPNEITSHLLNIIFTYLRFTKGPLNENGKPVQQAAPAIGGYGQMQSMNMGAVPNTPGMNQYAVQQTDMVQDGVEGGNDVHQAVIRVVKQNDTDEGVSVRTVAQALKSQFSEDQVRNALEWLSGEGHVYSTIDDDHFKSTDS